MSVTRHKRFPSEFCNYLYQEVSVFGLGGRPRFSLVNFLDALVSTKYGLSFNVFTLSKAATGTFFCLQLIKYVFCISFRSSRLVFLSISIFLISFSIFPSKSSSLRCFLYFKSAFCTSRYFVSIGYDIICTRTLDIFPAKSIALLNGYCLTIGKDEINELVVLADFLKHCFALPIFHS